LVGNPERIRTLWRPRLRFVDDNNNKKKGIKEIGMGDCEYPDVTKDRDSWRALVALINTVMNLHLPIQFCEIIEYLHNRWSLKEGSAR
jgi:hypothetical protein